MGYKLGHEGYLYWGNAALDDNIGGSGSNEADVLTNWNTGNAFELDIVSSDMATGGSPVEVDTTTMNLMRQAKTGSVEVATSGEITFDIQVDNIDVGNIRTIVKANRDKTDLSLLWLTEVLGTDGAWGFAANYTLSFDQTRPLQGVQVMQMRFKLKDYFDWVEDTGAAIQLIA